MNLSTQKSARRTEVHAVLNDNLVIEPVLIRQCRQIVQCQCVFLVDHLEGGNRFLNDGSSVFGNFWED